MTLGIFIGLVWFFMGVTGKVKLGQSAGLVVGLLVLAIGTSLWGLSTGMGIALAAYALTT